MKNLKINIAHILYFTKLLNKFQEVERVVNLPKREGRENDAEHSYQLAMLAWYIAESNELTLDKNLLLKYALVHDFVEVYAGDTFIYSKKQTDHETKHAREEEARVQLKQELPEFKEFHSAILEYEKLENKESRFIYVLDKIHPVLQIYLDDGRNWHEHNVTLEKLLDKKRDKMFLSPELLPYWEELEKILTENKAALFPENDNQLFPNSSSDSVIEN